MSIKMIVSMPDNLNLTVVQLNSYQKPMLKICLDKRPMGHISSPRAVIGRGRKRKIKLLSPEDLNPKYFFIFLKIKAQNQQFIISVNLHYQSTCTINVYFYKCFNFNCNENKRPRGHNAHLSNNNKLI